MYVFVYVVFVGR